MAVRLRDAPCPLAALGRLPDLVGADERAGVQPGLAGLGDAGDQELGDVRVDFEATRLPRGGHPVVAVDHVVIVADLHQVDRRQRLQPIDGAR